MQYCEITLSVAHKWKLGKSTLSISGNFLNARFFFFLLAGLGITWPPAEPIPATHNKVKYFLRIHPGGVLEHFESASVVTALYYEAMYVARASAPDRVCSYVSHLKGKIHLS